MYLLAPDSGAGPYALEVRISKRQDGAVALAAFGYLTISSRAGLFLKLESSDRAVLSRALLLRSVLANM